MGFVAAGVLYLLLAVTFFFVLIILALVIFHYLPGETQMQIWIFIRDKIVAIFLAPAFIIFVAMMVINMIFIPRFLTSDSKVQQTSPVAHKSPQAGPRHPPSHCIIFRCLLHRFRFLQCRGRFYHLHHSSPSPPPAHTPRPQSVFHYFQTAAYAAVMLIQIHLPIMGIEVLSSPSRMSHVSLRKYPAMFATRPICQPCYSTTP